MIFCLLVNGSWRYGEEFSNCSKTCGGGTRNKTKHCDYPQPSNGGQNCSCGKDENFTEIFCDGITAILQDSCNEDECLGIYNVEICYIFIKKKCVFAKNVACTHHYYYRHYYACYRKRQQRGIVDQRCISSNNSGPCFSDWSRCLV